MLIINTEKQEFFDEKNQEFITIPEYTLHMEHSLVSISKWEAEYGKPFLNNKEERTQEETLFYVKCMTFEQNIPEEVFYNLSLNNQKKINSYIEKKMTATWFADDKKDKKGSKKPIKRINGQIITAELIYYWMIELNIPIEFQKWHINRLLTLIKVCNEKHKEQSGDNKMSKQQVMARNRALNMQRRAKMKTRG